MGPVAPLLAPPSEPDVELRCPSRIHAVVDGDRYEVRCQSKHCGKRAGVVILHIFDMNTHRLIETKKFRDPNPITNKQEE